MEQLSHFLIENSSIKFIARLVIGHALLIISHCELIGNKNLDLDGATSQI